MNPVKHILFVSSNPHWTARLDLGDEMRELIHSLRGQDIELMPLPAAQREDLEVAVTSNKIDVLHFSGHATKKDGIILRDEDGMEDAVSPAQLKKLIEGKNIKLAFLNACSTEETAEAIKNNVDAVIGTTEPLDDEAAKKMTKVFYSELGSGHSIDEAFGEATGTVEKDGLNNVYMRTGKATDKPLVSKEKSDKPGVKIKGQPYYDKYFFVSYLDEQIRDIKGRVALNRALFWILFVVGIALAIKIWSQPADNVEMELLFSFFVNFFGEVKIDPYVGKPYLDSLLAIGTGIPVLLAFFQNRLTVTTNQKFRSLMQLKEVAKASEELSPEMQNRLQKILDQCIRGADKEYKPFVDWYEFFNNPRYLLEFERSPALAFFKKILPQRT